MRNRYPLAITRQPNVLTLAAATWLACGLVLYGLTPLPLRDASLGWSATYWLLAAPCVLLVARRLFVSRRPAISPRHKARPIRRMGIQAKPRPDAMATTNRRARTRGRRIAA